MRLTIALFFALACNVLLAFPAETSPNIHVDQFGYLPDSRKIAVIANPIYGYNSVQTINVNNGDTFELRDWSTDAVMFSAQITAWNNGTFHDQSGDIVYWFDFSSVTNAGSYYVHGNALNISSGKFEIGDCVYNQPFIHALRTFFYQRCGTAKHAEFAGAAWADEACHVGANQDTQCYPYNNATSGMKDLSGGWHDAGDYNKYVNFAYEPILDLCDAVIRYPEVFNEALNIPESGNGNPDIKDEIKHELDWLLKMQNTDGSVLCMVGETVYGSASPPSTDQLTRVYGPATTASTCSAAAMFARASNLFVGAYRTTLITAAQNAWTWSIANPDVVFYNSGVINSGEQQTDTYETSMRQLTAAIYLLEVTNDQQYLDYVLAHYGEAHMMQWGFVYPFESAIQNALIHFAEFSVNNALSANIHNTYMQSVSQNNAELLPAFLNQSDAYMAYMSDQNYTWGSNTTKARNAIIFQNMRALNLDPTNNTNYTESSLGFVHYFHGVNPNGTCFLSNMNNHGAEKSVNSFYHGWFEDGSPLWDEVGVSLYGPPAGFIPGGPNPTYTLDSCCPDGCGSAQVNGQCDVNLVSPPLGQPIQKAWKDWNAGWPQNSWTVTEIAIYTQAAYIKMLAQFISQSCINTSIAEMEAEQKIGVKIFPNPCRDQLVINSDLLHAETSSLSILDALGRVVYQKQLINSSERSTQIINTKDFPNGMYVLRLEAQGETTTVKFLKED